MERKEFLKMGLSSLEFMAIAPLVIHCKTASVDTNGTVNANGSTNGSSPTDCVTSALGEEGPFPTHSPANYGIKDITADRKGVKLTANFTIKNKNNVCGAIEGAFVDIWHCDADGNYSEYGGLTSAHFLRGRQITDANGLVSFASIFPGWYNGRAVHIHLHIYDKSGKSLLISQVAFPATVCDTVYTTATSFYKKGKADTSNESDNVFKNTLSTLLGTVSGNINDGYLMSHNFVINA